MLKIQYQVNTDLLKCQWGKNNIGSEEHYLILFVPRKIL
jgi:hypothetical protein